ncbi:hypothetical protein CDAR_490851 [Caerostris darwini]|uniref:Uncharacterized protein n=1 Tax=Caerostris darwini TaxID=1538125 RepID=A0AAV4NJ99_9ARAC|nr:hypothetical protein CDAR_490851 [Caerostris darwini]
MNKTTLLDGTCREGGKAPAWVIARWRDPPTCRARPMASGRARLLSARSHLKHPFESLSAEHAGQPSSSGWSLARLLCFFPKGASSIRFPLECNAGSP